MIKIEVIKFEDGLYTLERELSADELKSVSSKRNNGTHVIYYQGDEPFIEPIEEPITLNWLGLEQQLRYSNLFAKAYNDANGKGLNMFTTTLVNGKLGHAKEPALEFAFSVLGVTWTESEVLELNTILENNNFTIRL
jgi:hypothetical protein